MTQRNGRLLALVLAALASCSTLAEAHSPINGLGTFYNSMLHPLAVPAHALVLIAISLLLGQQGRNAAGLGSIAFALGLATGLAISGAGLISGVREPVLLAGCLVAGGAVSLGYRPPIIVLLVLAVCIGVLIGLDSAPDPATEFEVMLAYAGVTSGVLYLVTVIAGLTINLSQSWQRVGVRIAGSWIFAAALLVLSLSALKPAAESSPVTQLELGRTMLC